jgi:hypothetical protein
VVASTCVCTGSATIRYRLLDGEPPEHRPRSLLLALPLASARLVLHACLTLVRLMVMSVVSLVIVVVLFSAVSGRSPAFGDANGYLASVLRVSADWMDSDPQLSQGASDLISETSSTAIARPTPAPGSAAALVATLSQLTPPELQQVYQEAIPALQQYDAMLTDVQSALANNSDLDAFFADLEPWLNQAEAESNGP